MISLLRYCPSRVFLGGRISECLRWTAYFGGLDLCHDERIHHPHTMPSGGRRRRIIQTRARRAVAVYRTAVALAVCLWVIAR